MTILAYYESQVVMTSLIKKFTFEDVGEQIMLKVASSLQPWVVGKEAEGPQLPVFIRLL